MAGPQLLTLGPSEEEARSILDTQKVVPMTHRNWECGKSFWKQDAQFYKGHAECEVTA